MSAPTRAASELASDQPIGADIIEGAAAIGAEMNLTERQARHLIRIGAVPVFRLHQKGGRIFASRAALRRWLAERAQGIGNP